MNGAIARAVDRVNSALVAWRVGGRQPALEPSAMRHLLAELPRDLVESRDERVANPRRASSRGRVESWTDAESDWVAQRVAPSCSGHAAVVVLHGWLATPAHIALHKRLALPVVSEGVEVWAPRLPYHAERTPPGAVSGQLFLSADPVQTAVAIRTAVAETRALIRWLRENGRSRVALWGTSLGGWVAALVATCPDPFRAS